MLSSFKKNKKLLLGLFAFVVLALLGIFIQSSDENDIKRLLRENVGFVNIYDNDTPGTCIPKAAKIIADYSGRRSTTYYQYNERVFCYDKESKTTEEIQFGYGYDNIKAIYVSPAKSRIFVVLDMGSHSSCYVRDGQQLWVINTLNHQTRKLQDGFRVEKRKGCIVMGKADFCVNSNAPINQRKWKCRNHYFDFTGKIIWSMDDYFVMEKDFLH